jgi:hypothetical protein
VLDVAVDDTTNLFDTDRADYAKPDYPTWNDDLPYRSTNACNQAPTDTFGELVPPTAGGGGTELSTAVMDPDGDWLLAFYPLAQDNTQYGCSRSYRVGGSDIADGTTPWEPLKEHVYGNYVPDGGQRELVVSGSGSWVDQQKLLRVWAPGAAHDAVFDGDGVNGYDLLVASDHLWWIPQEDTVAQEVGWNTTAGSYTWADLDNLPWVYAWGTGETHQVTVVREVSTCHGCDGSSDRVIAGLWDVAAAELHTDTPGRSAGDRDCHFEPLNVGKTSVDVWQDEDGGTKWQAWYAMRDQNDASDAGLKRVLILYDDDSGDYCWDAVEPGTRGAFFDGTPKSDLMCADVDPTNVWTACNSADPFQMHGDDQGVGTPWQIRAIAEDTALLVARDACLDPSCSTEAGGGLYVVSGKASTGLNYAKLDGYVDDGSNTCPESEYFDILGAVTVHPDSDPTGSGFMRLFVAGRAANSGRACGVREVTFTLGAEASAVWTFHDTDTGLPDGCVLQTGQIRGIEAAPSGRYVMAYGGRPDGNTLNGGVCALDLSTSPVTYEQAVRPASFGLEVYSVLPHPHIENMFFFGGIAANDCTTCSDEGLYALQHRYRPAIDDFVWASRLISGDDLENPRVTHLDWGHGPDPEEDPMSRIYLGTDGSGVWDTAVGW